MSGDVFNALFEFCGSILTWVNVYRVWKDRGYAGVYVPSVVFFFTWGTWNLFYYGSLQQYWSRAACVSLVLANMAWVALMLYFGKIRRA